LDPSSNLARKWPLRDRSPTNSALNVLDMFVI
jgi:hypothetical protein